jgi:hypothetical protein
VWRHSRYTRYKRAPAQSLHQAKGKREALTGSNQSNLKMASPESNVHSFIIKLWFEKASRVAWHGQITHLPGGEQRYLKNLDEISAFIQPFLEAKGDSPSFRQRIKRWLSWRRR